MQYPTLHVVKFFRQILLMLLGYALLSGAPLYAKSPSIAFHYGNTPPTQSLSAFDWVVVEPAHLPSPPTGGNTQWFAYISLGEMSADRAYAKEVPAAWKQGKNTAWDSWVMDQTQADWPDFVVNRIVTPLWNAGYRGFFLDTLDSWQIIARTDAERKAQAAGLVRTISAIKARYPQIKLIANRGFEIMPQIHNWLTAVAFESYYQGWDASKKNYVSVSQEDRNWLDGQLRPIREQYRLPVIAIDYVDPKNTILTRQTVDKLQASGFIPWVTDPNLETLGGSSLDILPRTILLLYDSREIDQVISTEIQFAATILGYMGYTYRHLDVATAPPAMGSLPAVAGMVSWLNGNSLSPAFQQWLQGRLEEGIPWVALDQFGFELDSDWRRRLKLSVDSSANLSGAYTITKKSALVGLETPLPAAGGAFRSLSANDAQVQLELRNAQGAIFQPVAVTSWGGYALFPFMTSLLPDLTSRWVIDPFTFFSQALRLPVMPMPDVTTENGRRILLSHIDGDGFVSPAEFPGYPSSGEVMLKEILQPYRQVPITVSIVEGEIGPKGLYPAQSARHEKTARQIFALPNVEIASHSYSHPFYWSKAVGSSEGEGYTLNIPGYDFSTEREIMGSVDYINTRLAPPGKKTRVFLWTGDCDPPESVLRATREAGLLNMNAGDTLISKTQPTLTAVAPIGMYKGQELQVFAPNQNENVYTNFWQGPYYGYQRVIETFQMTESPRRLKPINIYYHFYSASKRAALLSLQRAYDWALTQEVNPMFGSEYIERAEGFFNISIARAGENRFAIRNAGALRTLRLPVSAGYPDMTASRNVAGFFDHQGERYIHLSAAQAELSLSKEKPGRPYLAYANAQLANWTPQATGLQFELKGWLPLKFAVGQAKDCQFTVGNKAISGRFDGELTHFELPQHASEITLRCQP